MPFVPQIFHSDSMSIDRFVCLFVAFIKIFIEVIGPGNVGTVISVSFYTWSLFLPLFSVWFPVGLYLEIGPTEENNVSSFLKCNILKWMTWV